MSWIITVDNVSNPVYDEKSRVNTCSEGYEKNGEDLIYKFRMLNYENEICYEGKTDDVKKHSAYDALNWGMLQAGCCTFEYKKERDKTWQKLS